MRTVQFIPAACTDETELQKRGDTLSQKSDDAGVRCMIPAGQRRIWPRKDANHRGYLPNGSHLNALWRQQRPLRVALSEKIMPDNENSVRHISGVQSIRDMPAVLAGFKEMALRSNHRMLSYLLEMAIVEIEQVILPSSQH